MSKETPEEKELRLAQEAVDKIVKEAEEAEKVAKAAEDKKAEKAEQARIKLEEDETEAKRLADVERNKVDSISIKGVVLNGSAAQKKGTHTVHLTPSRIINFVDGKADVRADDEQLLKKQGYIE